MNCHDCGEPARANGLIHVVDGERREYCETHGTLRWQMGCDKSPGWLKASLQDKTMQWSCSGPLPENRD